MNDRIWSHYKRFLELYYGDPDSRQRYEEAPEAELRRAGLELDPRFLAEAKLIAAGEEISEESRRANPYTKEFADRIRAVHAIVDGRARLEHVVDAKLRRWMARQRNRLAFVSRDRRRRHSTAPIAFELSSGCSAQCPFCCFAPAPLAAVFRRDAANRRLWIDVLEASRDLLGDMLGNGVCYHATEPMDNPDYELFIEDFHRVAGCWPQTTTSMGLRDVSRTRKLFDLLAPAGLREAALRFSVLSLDQLRRFHGEFSPDELKYVELLMNNPESQYKYVMAGRARNLSASLPAEKVSKNGTTACITGFVVNMPERTVSLVSPEPACDEYPLGMDVYETLRFDDAGGYKEALRRLIDRWMTPELPVDAIVGLHRGIRCEREADGLVFRGDGVSRKVGGNECFYGFMDRARQGNSTMRRIAEDLAIGDGSMLALRPKLEMLRDFGYFREHQ